LYLLSLAAVFVRTEDSTTVGMRPRAALNQGEIDVRCSSPDSTRARGGWLYGGIELIHGRFEWRIDRPSEVAGHRSIYTAFSRCTLDATSVTLTCDSYERQERAGVQHNNIRSEFFFQAHFYSPCVHGKDSIHASDSEPSHSRMSLAESDS
jgi:hypothetical protein